MSAFERLWSRVTIESPGGCWVYGGYLLNGYGRLRGDDGRKVLAHRLAYEQLVGPIPEGLTLDHVKARGCASKACVNPGHLEPVTMRENTMRGNTIAARNAAKTHCPKGHPYDERNTYFHVQYVRGHGFRRRMCRACKGLRPAVVA